MKRIMVNTVSRHSCDTVCREGHFSGFGDRQEIDRMQKIEIEANTRCNRKRL